MARHDRVRVQIAAAGLDDVGEPRARVSRTLLEALHLEQGAPVRLVTAEKSVLLHALPAGVEDDGLDVVRIDGTQRRKLGVEVGDNAILERYDGRPAERITLVASEDLGHVDLPMHEIRSALAERPVVVGDTVKVTPMRKTFDAQVNLLGLTVAGVEGSVNDAEGVMLHVTETSPSGVVTVGDATKIDVRSVGVSPADEDVTRA
jgi:hypothetical protein